jgi:hypothetical protein
MKRVTILTLLSLGWVVPAFATPIPFTDTTPGTATFTVPEAGIYSIEVIGAEGGGDNGGRGGYGVTIADDFALAANETLSLLVGGVGGTGFASGGGGGGTFVAASGTPLLVAGGGGGNNGGSTGQNASTTTAGGGGANGGTNGNGGKASAAGAGGGFYTNGQSSIAAGGESFLNGGAGGSGAGCCGASGGIGGGGGADNTGGGGGGYSGGADGGAGGGSFDGGLGGLDYIDTVNAGVINNGNGEIEVTLVESVPEPATAVLLGLPLLAVAFVRRLTRAGSQSFAQR